MTCRFCSHTLEDAFVDLVSSPPSNAFLREEQLGEPETYFPLKVFICKNCLLVQIPEYKKASDIFVEDYAYFSSFSKSWLEHSRRYVEHIISTTSLSEDALVIEIASNDGYLLQYFLEKKIPVLGIEPTLNTAEVARKKGIETIVDFFGVSLAQELANLGKKADLLLGNNVLAHVPDINDFVKGLKIALKPEGFITMEFPHLMQLIDNSQFDTIYHEHYSYLSLVAVEKIFKFHELQIFDVEEIPTHGGSLRIYAKHVDDTSKEISNRVNDVLSKEQDRGLHEISSYKQFQAQADVIKNNFLSFLLEQKRLGKKIAAYGAAAKGNTLLNYCGIKKDLISFVSDASPHKQGKFLPGSHIPITSEMTIKEAKPDYIVVFPWNIKEEIINQLSYVREWNAKFVVAIPKLIIL
jgi:2-polyprenyl-3-methyl-5-hydroxy-6-metoxy-1,4-benzoquinol methylase